MWGLIEREFFFTEECCFVHTTVSGEYVSFSVYGWRAVLESRGRMFSSVACYCRLAIRTYISKSVGVVFQLDFVEQAQLSFPLDPSLYCCLWIGFTRKISPFSASRPLRLVCFRRLSCIYRLEWNRRDGCVTEGREGR